MTQLNLIQIQERQKAIHFALENNQVCPFCGSGLISVGTDKDGDIFNHNCECLLELDLAEFSLTESNFILDQKYPIDDNFNQKSHSIPIGNQTYVNFCHHCKQFGVNSNDPQCTEDPPYRYRCRFCHHSLRTHSSFGEGMKFDFALKNITWGYRGKYPVLFNR